MTNSNAVDQDVQEIEQFLQAWGQEFARAVEMFTGNEASVSCSETSSETEHVSESNAYFWRKQVFESGSAFTTWIGAEESTWSTLGNALETDANEAKSMYLEMISQAQQGVATVASMGLPQPIKCQAAEDSDLTSLNGMIAFRIAITYQDKTLSPLLYVTDRTAAAVIRGPAPIQTEDQPGAPAVNLGPSAPILERLMDLELPLSVALGRAVMPIRDVLRVTSGSMIELDRTVDDYVELIVHGTVVARGEVVSVKGNYGVRIKEIISRNDRLTLYGS